jgi:hypothetical protein
MPKANNTEGTSATRITIDLKEELNPAELAKFEAAARLNAAGCVKDHFLNVFVRPAIYSPNREAAL